MAGGPAAAPPARRHHRQHPPRRVLHRQAVRPRSPSAAASAWSSCAASRCRRTRGWPSSRPCSCGRSSPACGAAPTRRRWSAGAPSCTTASCCRGGCRPTSRAVVADLQRHGCSSTRTWLRPVPRVPLPAPRRASTSTTSGIELRTAIEPWNVLGEEVTRRRRRATSTRRSSGSQVRVDGLTESRYAVTCNGCAVPLQPTETPGTFVAGVRYRAWQPPVGRCTRPSASTPRSCSTSSTAGAGARSAAAPTTSCTRAGVAYDRSPVNANEAEARRASRFEPLGHTPGRDRRRTRSPISARAANILGRSICGASLAAELKGRTDAPTIPAMSTTALTTPGPGRARPPARALPPAPGCYDEMLDRDGRPASALGAPGRARSPSSASTSCSAARTRRRACSTRTASSTTPTTRPGRATRAPRAGCSTRCPPSSRAAGVGGDRDRGDRAGRAAQPRARRPVRAARAAAPAACSRPRSCSATTASCASATAIRLPGAPAAVHLRRRHRARRRGALPGALRPHPGAVGLRLRAREPRP